jgi:hypothetical protein
LIEMNTVSRFYSSEWDLFRGVLNEVTHGFSKSVGDFESVIGMPKVELEGFLDHLCTLPESAVVDLDSKWILVFRNALRETLHYVPDSEFAARTGHDSTEANRTLKKLDGLLSG